MSGRIFVALLSFLAATLTFGQAPSVLFTNAQIYDGTGGKPYRGDVRISGDTIVEVGAKLKKNPSDQVVDAHGMALSPGFIDMHSHADSGIFEKSHDAVIRQGITTVLVGQDGGSVYPLKDFFAKLEQKPPAMNVASMAGHATIRAQVMGKDLYRASTPAELEKMFTLLHGEMLSGAMGMSTGLEYEEGHFATTDEVASLTRMAKMHGGFYNSHVRDEGNGVFDSFAEIIEIGKRSGAPVVITHIKLGSTPVWHQAATKMPGVFAKAAAAGVDLKADVYPYVYWHSTWRVLMLDRDFFNPEKVKKAIADNGGADHLRVSRYEPDASLEGKNLDEVAAYWKVTPEAAYMRIIKETMPSGDFKGADEGVIGEGMAEDDVKWFIAQPQIMFSTDGQLEGEHPRGAGSFPRILGRYVREQKVLPLEAAIRKMTSLPAQQLHLADRGRIAKGMKADLVLFDPKTVIDRSTIQHPLAPPSGILDVMVNGQWAVRDEKPTAIRAGKPLRLAAAPGK